MLETINRTRLDMTDKEKIRAEIESRLKRLTDGCVGQRYAYRTLLEFIDSLPEEPVIKNLEEAARRYAALQAGMKDAMTSEYYEEYPYSPNDIEAFKAGAQWKNNQGA